MKSVSRVVGGSILAAALLLLAGCNQVIQNPVPSIQSLSPNFTTAGGATLQLTVNGKDFVFGGFVIWNGRALTTLYVNSHQLQATINPSDITQPGPAQVTVFNPGPGGGQSNQVNFAVNPATSPVPAISTLQPAASMVGGNGFTLTVNGLNFTQSSVITWNGANLSTAYVNNTELQAAVSATNLQDPGAIQVAVLNGAPGGGLSNSLDFLVDNAIPVISSITPTTSVAGAAGFTLTVQGRGFSCQDLTTTTTTTGGVTTSSTSCPQSTSVIEWNGAPISTSYDVAAQQLTATVSTQQLAEAGTAFVTVFNPTPGGGSSADAYFQVIPGPNGEGLPALVDVSSNGAQANNGIGNLGNSGPVIAAGGRFIVFSSVSQNLVANLANGAASVFLRDTCLGISSGCVPQTTLISQANDGEAANADSLEPSISSDGRYVVFSSAATNLSTAATTGAKEIYLRDTCLGAASGCIPSTTLVSVATDGVSAANGSNTQPYISADGQFIAFISTATNLVSSATTGAPEVYLRNTCLNASGVCTPSTTLVSVAADGSTPADGTSGSPVVASGGRYVAFQSTATNLVSIPSSATQQLYWRDTCIGATSCTPSTSLVSIASDGTSPGNGASGEPAISSDGRYVVFGSQATNLIGAGFVAGTPQQIYERDMCVGASSCTPTTSLVSVATDGSSPANALAENPQTDQTGRYVLFASPSSNLISSATNGFEQIYARDTCLGASGCTPRTVLISVAAGGAPIGNGNSLYPAITTQAHFGVFLSFASNIVGDDITPSLEDIFLVVTPF
ncbi:MAG TPA: IPT/TIG domain-containing protein [Candidatus Dormibacteraeota bacterium]|nr:IPT/TIG domain-containing protein [Candidatus Dormibacteraeota bacterium]